MTDQKRDYWSECISQAADEYGLTLTSEQLGALADAAESGHERYSQAFHDPGWGERMSDIEDGYRRKIKELEEQVLDAHNRGELCAKRLLGLWPDEQLSIDKHGHIERPTR